MLRVRGMGCTYAGTGVIYGDTIWDFDGAAIFKRAVKGMTEACARVMRQAGVSGDQIELVIPHQANLRIIEAVAKYAAIPMDRVIVTVEKYANMSAATVPVGLVETLKEGRLRPGALLLMPGFGGGLTFGALLVRWGDRVTPLGTSPMAFPACDRSALEIVQAVRATQDPHGRSSAGLTSPVFAESNVSYRSFAQR